MLAESLCITHRNVRPANEAETPSR